MPKQQSVSGITLKNLYQRCNKLTVDRFQDCLDGDLTALIIDGSASEEQLNEVWDNIYLEYCQLSQGDSYNELFELQREVKYLKAKISLVDMIVDHLQMCYSSELVELLNSLNLKCDLKPQHSGSALAKKLNAVVGRAKKWIITLQQRQLDIDKLMEKGMVSIDSNYFDDQLDAISLYSKYQVKASDITVSRFCRTLNKMHDEFTKQELKKHSKNGH